MVIVSAKVSVAASAVEKAASALLRNIRKYIGKPEDTPTLPMQTV
jgi:hypothetical protein